VSLLNSITAQKNTLPPRVLIHGPEKIGKSTFFGGGTYGGQRHDGVERAVFIQTEDGLSGTHAQAFPLCNTYPDVLQQIGALGSEDHGYTAIVIDSVDWLEKLIVNHVVETSPEGKGGANATIETAHGGWGKGFGYVAREMQKVLDSLNYLRINKGMLIGLICHSQVVQYNDPLAEPYDRYELKLHQPKKSRGVRDMVSEWVDVIGFAQREVLVSRSTAADGQKIARGIAAPQSSPILHLTPQPGFIAGNRYGMAGKIQLSWAAFMAAYSQSTGV
jgi:hypothetical protein